MGSQHGVFSQYLIWLLIAGNSVALLIGMTMFIAPARLDRWLGLGMRWFSTRRLLRPLEVPHETDHLMLNYPRVLGSVLVVGAAFILVQGGLLVAKISVAEGGRYLAAFFAGAHLPPSAWETLWISVVTLACVGAAAAAAVGVLALVRVHTLRRLSEVANRWLSTRQASKPLETPYYGVDSLVRTRPRLWGVLIVLAAVYSLVVLAWFVRGG